MSLLGCSAGSPGIWTLNLSCSGANSFQPLDDVPPEADASEPLLQPTEANINTKPIEASANLIPNSPKGRTANVEGTNHEAKAGTDRLARHSCATGHAVAHHWRKGGTNAPLIPL